MTACIATSLPAALRRPSLGSLLVALALSACGGGGSSDATNTQPNPTPPPVVTNPQPDPTPPPVVTNPLPDPAPPPVAQKDTLTLLAGTLGGPGNLDGAGAAARFDNPTGLAIGPDGNLYVADTGNRRIRKVTPTGVVSTVAGSGQTNHADGPALQASFCNPIDVAVGPDASVFVVDSASVRKIDNAGNVTTVAGAPPGDCDRKFVTIGAVPSSPSAIAVDAFGIAYIADSFAGAIYTLTPTGALTLLAGSADAERPNTAFRGASGIALDAARNLYVLGAYSSDLTTVSIVRISQAGELTTVVPPSPGLSATRDLARDAAGNLYVIDGSASRVVRKITPDGRISIIAGVNDTAYEGGSVDGPLGTGRLGSLRGIAAAPDGTVYVSDGTDTIRRIDAATGDLSTLAGLVPRSPYGDYTTDRAGNVFVVVARPPYNDEYSIDRIAPDGTTTTRVPRGVVAPGPMAVDSAGNLYVLNRFRFPVAGLGISTGSVVRKITPQGEVSIFAGSLQSLSQNSTQVDDVDGAGSAAVLHTAVALTIDPADNLYVAQYLGAPLRKITPQGVVSTALASLPGTDQYPNVVTADAAGNLYLASCRRPVANFPVSLPVLPNAAVLKVDPNGNSALLAGSLTEAGYADGPGAQARFAATEGRITGLGMAGGLGTCPSGLTLDTAGNVFVADTGNDTIRKITPGGVVSTAVGQQSVRGVSLGPLPASLSRPGTLSFDAAGNLVIRSEGALLKVQLSK